MVEWQGAGQVLCACPLICLGGQERGLSASLVLLGLVELLGGGRLLFFLFFLRLVVLLFVVLFVFLLAVLVRVECGVRRERADDDEQDREAWSDSGTTGWVSYVFSRVCWRDVSGLEESARALLIISKIKKEGWLSSLERKRDSGRAIVVF